MTVSPTATCLAAIALCHHFRRQLTNQMLELEGTRDPCREYRIRVVQTGNGPVGKAHVHAQPGGPTCRHCQRGITQFKCSKRMMPVGSSLSRLSLFLDRQLRCATSCGVHRGCGAAPDETVILLTSPLRPY